MRWGNPLELTLNARQKPLDLFISRGADGRHVIGVANVRQGAIAHEPGAVRVEDFVPERQTGSVRSEGFGNEIHCCQPGE